MRRFLFGPAFERWLRTFTSTTAYEAMPSLRRQMDRWKTGTPVDYYKADKYLTQLDLTEWDIPEECWITDPKLERLAGQAISAKGYRPRFEKGFKSDEAFKEYIMNAIEG